jgi:hypothetical protein
LLFTVASNNSPSPTMAISTSGPIASWNAPSQWAKPVG